MITRCTRCLIPTTRPDTAFVGGVCSACIAHDAHQQVDWALRYSELVRLLDSRRRPGAEFDCVVASSGGKDSIAQVLSLLDIGAHPLVVTATTCMLTETGRYNIDVLKRYAPTIEVTPDQQARARLNRFGLEMVGDVSWPEHVAIFTTPMRVAVAMGLPLVFYGENPQAQYGGPLGTQDARQMTRRWVSEFGGFLGLRPVDAVLAGVMSKRNMLEYVFPDDESLARVGTEAHFLGQYLGPWDSRANAARAIKAGMRTLFPSPSVANWWQFENLDNAMTGLHDHMMYLKYGYGRACAQVSVDIRKEYLNRDAGLRIVTERDGILPETYAGVSLDSVLERIDVTREELKAIFTRFTNHDLFSLYGDSHAGEARDSGTAG